ncbi:hypothetical protein [Lignipirellula cremea]|uniref:SLA1 homology domain-containing protein n=1 Tax=Lignipirellula cremea TaxID=2528010 RepID=A0A518DSB0_9BACT|nr:hypothetical protein [Lignipirellula cremea]QDU94727.1 hypothetical protein Pla8534_25330 [Lignipirellula cremea]
MSRVPPLINAAFAICFAFFAGCAVSPAAAQEIWDYSPYEIEVWLAFGDSPELTPRFREETEKRIFDSTEAYIGGAWNLHFAEPPPQLVWDIAHNMEALTADRIDLAARTDPDFQAKVLAGDKLILVSVLADTFTYYVAARELDCRTRTWGPIRYRTTQQRSLLPYLAYEAVAESFLPLVRIEEGYSGEREEIDGGESHKVRADYARVQIRAGCLIVGDDHPALPKIDSVFRPIIRRNNRMGKPQAIQEIPWTYMVTRSRDGVELHCEVFSGMRSPLAGKSGRRTLRLAVAIEPPFQETLLQLESRVSNTNPAPAPLPGYEIYEKNLLTGRSELLGETDWRGALNIPKGESPVRLLYIKSGDRLLARLPLIPGAEESVTAEIYEDELRLEAESVNSGFQARVMDLVARRQVLASQVRTRIEKEKYDEAEKIIAEVRSFNTLSDMINELGTFQKRYATKDVRLKSRIDPMFQESRDLIYKFLAADLANELLKELNAAKSGG